MEYRRPLPIIMIAVWLNLHLGTRRQQRSKTMPQTTRNLQDRPRSWARRPISSGLDLLYIPGTSMKAPNRTLRSLLGRTLRIPVLQLLFPA